MKKKCLAMLLAVVMAFSLLPGTAFAASASGSCGANVRWSYNNGTLTIEGTGPMNDYNMVLSVPPWYSAYHEDIHTVIIGSGVTTIGDFAFWSCASLTSVTIPDSVTSIGGQAFSNCTSLASLTIPSSVTSIGSSAFDKTPWLESLGEPEFLVINGVLLVYQGSGGNVTIPSSVTSICDWAFYSCTSLTSVTIPSSVTSIGRFAFSGCKSLARVTIPDSVTEIGEYAFFNCESLTSVAIPASVTSIGNGAFGYCDNLASVTIPGSVTSIGDGAFDKTPWLKSLGEFPIVNGFLLAYQGNGGNVTIPSGITSISGSAFYNCTSLTSVTIPDSVTSIGNEAFSGCNNLTSVTIPGSVTSIGRFAFNNCKSLTSVTIPAGVTSIGNGAFRDCDNLTSVTIPSSVTTIGEQTFRACSSLVSVTIPDSVTTIEDSAFYQCDSLTEVYYGGSASQWAQISILKVIYGNDLLLKANIHYNSAMPTTPEPPATTTFTDVPAGEWYADAVAWAVENEVTTGTGDGTTFSPKRDCTHKEILTFLYRAARGGTYSADDMDQAVSWAQEKGMINDTFDGSKSCTRADAVNYIWQAFDKPGAAASSFIDVLPSDAYAKAVDWAVEKGVTYGTDSEETLFSPDVICTRGHIVTFLYRAYNS